MTTFEGVTYLKSGGAHNASEAACKILTLNPREVEILRKHLPDFDPAMCKILSRRGTPLQDFVPSRKPTETAERPRIFEQQGVRCVATGVADVKFHPPNSKLVDLHSGPLSLPARKASVQVGPAWVTHRDPLAHVVNKNGSKFQRGESKTY